MGYFRADAEYGLLTPQENIFYLEESGFELVELIGGNSSENWDYYSILARKHIEVKENN